jgi:hypothetical protein
MPKPGVTGFNPKGPFKYHFSLTELAFHHILSGTGKQGPGSLSFFRSRFGLPVGRVTNGRHHRASMQEKSNRNEQPDIPDHIPQTAPACLIHLFLSFFIDSSALMPVFMG